MSLKNEQKRQWAESLYTKDNLTQKEVAERVNVTPATMCKWVNRYKWDELKESIIVTKGEELRRLYAQVRELNNAIAQRQEGYRYATGKEADTLSKLTTSIRRLETETSIAQIIDVGKAVLEWLRPQDAEKAKEWTGLFDAFIKSKL